MSGAAAPGLSVVIPAYQEGALLPASLERLRRHLDRRTASWEIIVVDDGSTDGTRRAAEAAGREDGRIRLARHPANLGKGAAVASGLREARGGVVAVTDADLSYDLEDLDRVVAAVLGGADVAAGSRLHRSSRIALPFTLFPYLGARWLAGWIFRLAAGLLFGLGRADTQCGLKAFGPEAVGAVREGLVTEGFVADIEIFLIARERGLTVEWTPVHLSYLSRDSSVRLLGGLPRLLADLVRIKRAQLRGRYAERRGG